MHSKSISSMSCAPIPMQKIRPGIARTQAALIIVVIVVAAGVGAYALIGQGPSGNSSTVNSQEFQIKITETDSVNQIDNFVPQNVTAKLGTNVTLAVQNGDD